MKRVLPLLFIVCLLFFSCKGAWELSENTTQEDAHLVGKPEVVVTEPAKDDDYGKPPSLKADDILQATIGDNVDFLSGITATDASGNNIIDMVKWNTSADLSKAGQYTVYYTVTDKSGNIEKLSRILIINEPPTFYNREEAIAIVNATADKYHAMGISVAVIENGKVTDSIASGDAVYNIREMTTNTKIRVASISKVVVAMAAFKMYDDGLIDIDEDISVYWGTEIRNPQYPDMPITIRDLLCHTSSLRNEDSNYIRGVDKTLDQLISGSVFSSLEPGNVSSYIYNNYAFGILADTLELAYGENLDAYIKKNIFEKMEIEASYVTSTLKAEELASLYNSNWDCVRSVEYMANRPIRTELGCYISYYAGNLTISAGDLGKLITVLMNDGMYEDTRILSGEAVALLEEPQFTINHVDPLEYIQCLPVRYRNGMYGRTNLYYHTGTAYGVFSLMCYDPDSGDGVIVITTGATTGYDENQVTNVCGDIAAVIMEMLEGNSPQNYSGRFHKQQAVGVPPLTNKVEEKANFGKLV